MTDAPWARFPVPRAYAPSVTGAPLPGAKLYFYATGTTTPLDTYSDSARSQPNLNPVEADQGGNFGDIFLQDAEYRVTLTDASGVEQWTADPVAPYFTSGATGSNTVVLELTVDGNGSVPATGICGDQILPFAATVTQNYIQSTQTGSVVVDVWAALYATNTPPTVANSIVASAPPTLTSGTSSSDSTLAGWNTSLAAGTWLRYNIRSVSGLTRFTLSLVVLA